jgi:hypothetical protein
MRVQKNFDQLHSRLNKKRSKVGPSTQKIRKSTRRETEGDPSLKRSGKAKAKDPSHRHDGHMAWQGKPFS